MWEKLNLLQDFLHFLINIMLVLATNELNIGKTNGVLFNYANDKLNKRQE